MRRGNDVGQYLVGLLLQLGVDGQADVRAIGRRLLAEHRQRVAVDIYLVRALAAHPLQQVLEGELRAALANVVAALVDDGLLRQQQVGLGHRADVSQDMGGHIAIWISADGPLHHIYAAEQRRVLLDIGDGVHRHIGGNHPVGLGALGVVEQVAADHALGDAQHLGQHMHSNRVLNHPLWRSHAQRRPIAYQLLAVAVQYPAAYRRGRCLGCHIVLGLLLIGVAGDQLQRPEPHRQGAEDPGNHQAEGIESPPAILLRPAVKDFWTAYVVDAQPHRCRMPHEALLDRQAAAAPAAEADDSGQRYQGDNEHRRRDDDCQRQRAHFSQACL